MELPIRTPNTTRFSILQAAPGSSLSSFAQAVSDGLGNSSKSLPCRFFYDDAGSRLFEQICTVPEYYLTRCERDILERYAPDIARHVGSPALLAELGSGSARKTQLLIEAFLAQDPSLTFIPIDIAEGMLRSSAEELVERYPTLCVQAIAGEYESGLHSLGKLERGPEPMLLAWLGSSIGNLNRDEAAAFLKVVAEAIRPGDCVLLGIDLRKDSEILERAYDDAQGVTAAFNLNLLTRINRELGADFDVDRFSHRATYLEGPGCVEIHLVSQVAQRVTIDAIGRQFDFAPGETIHSENSFKYSPAEIAELARSMGLTLVESWRDDEGLFSLNLLSTP